MTNMIDFLPSIETVYAIENVRPNPLKTDYTFLYKCYIFPTTILISNDHHTFTPLVLSVIEWYYQVKETFLMILIKKIDRR